MKKSRNQHDDDLNRQQNTLRTAAIRGRALATTATKTREKLVGGKAAVEKSLQPTFEHKVARSTRKIEPDLQKWNSQTKKMHEFAIYIYI